MMTETQVREKVRKLLTLAMGNSNPNEARLAAEQAAALAAKYGIRFEDISRADSAPPPPSEEYEAEEYEAEEYEPEEYEAQSASPPQAPAARAFLVLSLGGIVAVAFALADVPGGMEAVPTPSHQPIRVEPEQASEPEPVLVPEKAVAVTLREDVKIPDNAIAEAAREEGIPPALLKAVVTVGPLATSVRGTAKYLRAMIDRYGDLGRALAAYHAGPQMISSEIPPTEWAYVENVLTHYRLYHDKVGVRNEESRRVIYAFTDEQGVTHFTNRPPRPVSRR